MPCNPALFWRSRGAAAALAGLGLLSTGCAPRLAPLTRDYRLASGTNLPTDSLLARAAGALRQAGWAVQPVAGAALTTAPRPGADWLLYDMRLRVDAFPLGGGLVRVVFDPYRRYVWRSRTHVPYLPGGLLRTYAPPLDAALRAAGFAPEATGAARDLGRRANRIDS